MAAVAPVGRRSADISFSARWVLLGSFVLLAAPTFWTLSQQVWTREGGSQGPIVLATGAWLLWSRRSEFDRDAQPGAPWITAALLVPALAIYVFGRAYDFVSLEAAGLYCAGLAFLQSWLGTGALLKSWFPILYLAFLIPAPGWMIDALTAPLKQFVAHAATDLLRGAGIPIMQQGVTLVVAQYTLLVKDACSGMNSITGLLAIGLLYVYLRHRSSWRYSLVLCLLLAPIAIATNIFRIAVLVLLTYRFGDAIADGFLHSTTGILLFGVALCLMFVCDALLQRIWPQRGSR